LVLRLALEGYDVTGIGLPAVSQKLSREVEDAGGLFRHSSIWGVSGGDRALLVLESGSPFEAMSWGAEHRLSISAEPRESVSPTWRSAMISYPPALTQAVLPDVIDQVVVMLGCLPRAYAVRYSALPGGESYRRTTEEFSESGDKVMPRDVTDVHLEGVEVRTAASGQGVFATRIHRRGEQVMTTRGVRLNHQTEHSIQIALDQHLEPHFPVRLINHSCAPNLGVRSTAQGLPDFYALREIRAGEELNFDYAMTELTHQPRSNSALEFSLDCLCGEPNCRGTLGYYSTLPEGIKRLYGEHISAYLLALEETQRQPASTQSGGSTETTAP